MDTPTKLDPIHLSQGHPRGEFINESLSPNLYENTPVEKALRGQTSATTLEGPNVLPFFPASNPKKRPKKVPKDQGENLPTADQDGKKRATFSTYQPTEYFPSPLDSESNSDDLELVSQYIAPPGGADLWGLSHIHFDANSSASNTSPPESKDESQTHVFDEHHTLLESRVTSRAPEDPSNEPVNDDSNASLSLDSLQATVRPTPPPPPIGDEQNAVTHIIPASSANVPKDTAEPLSSPLPPLTSTTAPASGLSLEERSGWFLPVTFSLGYCIPALLVAGKKAEKTTVADLDGLVTSDTVMSAYTNLRSKLWPAKRLKSNSKPSTPTLGVPSSTEPFNDVEMERSKGSSEAEQPFSPTGDNPLLSSSPQGSQGTSQGTCRSLRSALVLSVSGNLVGLLAGIVNSACPLGMVALLDIVTVFINDANEPAWHGYGYAAIALGLSIAQAIAQGQIGRSKGHIRAQIHGSLAMMMMERLCEDTTNSSNMVALIKSPMSNDDGDITGETPKRSEFENANAKGKDEAKNVSVDEDNTPIVQLVNSDVEVIAEMVPYLLFGTLNMLDIVSAFTYLLIVVGWPGLFPIAVFIILVPLNKAISNRFVDAYEDKANSADARSRKVEEVLSFIRTIKYYAWERSMERDVSRLRNTEVGFLKGLMGYLMAFSCIVAIAAPLMQLSLFVALYFGPADQGRLDSTIIYQSIALISITSWNLSVVPYQVSEWSRVSVAIRRVERFLFQRPAENLDPLNEAAIIRQPEEGQTGGREKEEDRGAISAPSITTAGTITLTDIAFTHQFGAAIEELETEDPNNGPYNEHSPLTSPTTKLKSDSFLLRIPNLQINPGELALVVGKVGSGKSSLMAAILGQMVPVSGGAIAVSSGRLPLCSITGKISIVPQSPWILNGTVRNNIILDSKYDEGRYKRVLVASALAVDLANFANGDATVVGAKGATLSGGQRQRISIARALYREADIYIFDDSLSALDAAVGKQVFEKAINGFLANKTRIVVTHQLGLLPKADKIFAVGEGLVTLAIMPESVPADPEPNEGPLVALLRGWRLALELLTPPDGSEATQPATIGSADFSGESWGQSVAAKGKTAFLTSLHSEITRSSFGNSRQNSPQKSFVKGFSPSIRGLRRPTCSPSVTHHVSPKANPFAFRSGAVQAAEAHSAADLLSVPTISRTNSNTWVSRQNTEGAPTPAHHPEDAHHQEDSLPPMMLPAALSVSTEMAPPVAQNLHHAPLENPEWRAATGGAHTLSCATSGQATPSLAITPNRGRQPRSPFHHPMFTQHTNGSMDSALPSPQNRSRMPTLLLLGAIGRAQEEGDQHGLNVVASALHLSRLPQFDVDALSLSGSGYGSSSFAISRPQSPQSPLLNVASRPSPSSRRKKKNMSRNHKDDDALGSAGFALKAGTSPSRGNAAMSSAIDTNQNGTEDDDYTNAEPLTSKPVHQSLILYLKCVGGGVFWGGMLLLHFATVACSVWATWWLGQWAEGETYGLEEASGSLAVMGVYAAALVVSAIIVLFRELLWRSGAVKPPLQLYTTMTNAILAAPIAFFDMNPLGRILTRFTRDSDQIDYAIPTATNELIVSVAAQVGALAAICIALPYFTPVAVIILVVVPLLRPSQSLIVLRRVADAALSPVTELFTEAYSGGASIAVLQLSHLFKMRLQRALDDYNAARYMDKIAFEFVRFRVAIAMSVIGAGVMIVMTILRNSTSAATAGFVISQTIQITNFLSYMVEQLGTLTLSLNSVARVTDYGVIEPEVDGDEVPPPGWPVLPTVEFRTVNAQYRPELPIVIRNLSLSLAPGERIGVCGRTGSGKSTLIQCLLRMVPMLEGSHVLIDGLDTANLKLSCLRRRMTIIPQEPVIFEGTLRYNLDPVGEHSDDALMNALVDCHALSGFTAKFAKVSEVLPEQSNASGAVEVPIPSSPDPTVSSSATILDQLLSQDGLSLGQKQLLCLARAVLRGTNVLILDEATSSVDAVTDHLIQSVIRTAFKNCTVLTIAHRINTIIDSDRVLVLDRGAMAEFDQPAELMKNPNSIFMQLVKQSREEDH